MIVLLVFNCNFTIALLLFSIQELFSCLNFTLSSEAAVCTLDFHLDVTLLQSQ